MRHKDDAIFYAQHSNHEHFFFSSKPVDFKLLECNPLTFHNDDTFNSTKTVS